MSLPVVEVLLSTFNAGEYLKPLLESVIGQEGVEVRLRVRDDGSSDGTREALAGIKDLGNNGTFEPGEHLGAWRSYFRLLATSTSRESFIGFCDQDDVWLPTKLRSAVDLLNRQAARPSLYCGPLILADANLNKVGLSPEPRRPMSVANALVENVVLGPTIVINAPGRELLAGKLPRFAVMHDAWSYLVFAALGQIVYDATPQVLYRLHGGNALGIRQGLVARAKHFARHRSGGYLDEQLLQASEFLRLFGDQLTLSQRQLLKTFCQPSTGLLDRVRYALAPAVYRQRPFDNFVLRALLARRSGTLAGADDTVLHGVGAGEGQ